MCEDKRVKFAKMKLKNWARDWWYCIEEDVRRLGLSAITTWQEMKAKLQEKCMPTNCHYDRLCKQLVNLNQSSMSIMESKQKNEEFKIRNQVVKDPCRTLALVKIGLRAELPRQ